MVQPNIWPTADVPEMEGAFKSLGRLMVDVGLRLSMHVDAYVHAQQPLYPRDTLQRIISSSRITKVGVGT